MTKFLILGGTGEANQLSRALQPCAEKVIYSYAGRTEFPLQLPVPMRKGGFGGVEGLVEFIHKQGISHIIDVTHPFAEQMSQNAYHAAMRAQIPLIRFERPAWERRQNWIRVQSLHEAREIILQNGYKTVFLATGRQSLPVFAQMPEIHFVTRIIDKAPSDQAGLSHATILAGRENFAFDNERALFEFYKIEAIISKNSGGKAQAKLDAADALALPVIMVERANLGLPIDFDDISELQKHLLNLARGINP